MRRRRGGDDNVDLSGAEHAWWAGGERRTVSIGPPTGTPERRADGPATIPATVPTPLPTAMPAMAGAGAPAGSTLPSPAGPRVAAPPVPPRDPAAVAAAAAAARATLDPSNDPWRRSTSPGALAAYRALGIDWEANWDEVVTVFQEQAARWHPDRLARADAQVRAEGERRMGELTRAYHELERILRPKRRQLFTT